MVRPMPPLLSLAPRGVIVDQAGAYQGLAPWFEPRLLRELLRRYNEYQPLADFAQAWAAMETGGPASADDACREAALALAKARSLAALVEADEAPKARGTHPRRRRSDRPGDPPPDPDAEPSGRD